MQIKVPHTKCWLSKKSFDVKAALKKMEKLGQYCKDYLKLLKKTRLHQTVQYESETNNERMSTFSFLLRSGCVRLPEKNCQS